MKLNLRFVEFVIDEREQTAAKYHASNQRGIRISASRKKAKHGGLTKWKERLQCSGFHVLTRHQFVYTWHPIC